MFVKIVMEILLISALLLGLVLGYKKGFLKSAARPIRFFAALFVAFWVSDPISRNIVEPIIKNPVTNQIKGYLIENCPNITPQSASEDLPTLLKFSASIMNVDLSTLSSENTIEEIVNLLASPVVHLFSIIITFILVYFVTKLLCSLLITVISYFFKSGAIGLPNKLLGAIFGLFFAAGIAWIATMVFDFVIHTEMLASVAWAQNFEGGAVFNFFSQNSPIDILLGF